MDRDFTYCIHLALECAALVAFILTVTEALGWPW